MNISIKKYKYIIDTFRIYAERLFDSSFTFCAVQNEMYIAANVQFPQCKKLQLRKLAYNNICTILKYVNHYMQPTPYFRTPYTTNSSCVQTPTLNWFG